jgi:ubiquinone/menaquinone biosynthesis C-methylase UbiE
VSPSPFVEALRTYIDTPSLALWRAFKAKALEPVSFSPPVLDLACGTGHFARILMGHKVITGCDVDKNAIRVAAKERTLDTVSVADARALPYPDQSFSSVLSNCSLEHIPDVELAIAEVSRVLRPKGIFAFTAPSEQFNNLLFFPRFYNFLGLCNRARGHIEWYNSLQGHYHIDPLPVWAKRLNEVGFKLILYKYYMPYWPSLVFSVLDVTAKWSIRIPRRNPVFVQRILVHLIPNRLLFRIFYYSVVRHSRLLSPLAVGAGLLVVARKEAD